MPGGCGVPMAGYWVAQGAGRRAGAQYGPGMPLAEDRADPDMFGHLWPDLEPGAAGAVDEGLGAADDPADELVAGA